MHELSIAQSLLSIVLQEAQRHDVSRVSKVAVKVGALSSVVPHSLQFSFDLIKEGTLAAEAELVIEQVPAEGVCNECGHEFDMTQPVFSCPSCQCKDIQLVSGQELYVDHIEAE